MSTKKPKRLSAVLREEVVAKASPTDTLKILELFDDPDAVAKALPDVHSAIVEDAARRGKTREWGVRISRDFLAAELPEPVASPEV